MTTLTLVFSLLFAASALAAPPEPPSIGGMPPPTLINLLCQTFPSPAEELTRATDQVYAAYPPLMPTLTLSIHPSFGKVYRVEVSLEPAASSYGLWLAVPSTTCVAPFSPGRDITLTWATRDSYGPSSLISAKTLALISDTPLPTETFDFCLRQVFIRVRYVSSSFLSSFALRVSAFGRGASDLIVTSTSAISSRQTGCDGVRTHVTPPLTTAVVPGSVPATGFVAYTDSRCAGSTTVAVFPSIRLPTTDSLSFLGAYQFDCERLEPNPANPITLIPAGRCVVAVLGGPTGMPGFPVFLLGRAVTITADVPFPVSVSWAISPPNTAGFYALCRASGTGGSYSLGLWLYYPGGILSFSQLVGPAPIWAFTACLRSLTNDPTGLPDSVGRYRLLLTAITKVVPASPFDAGSVYSASSPVPFEVRYPCPASLMSSSSSFPFTPSSFSAQLSNETNNALVSSRATSTTTRLRLRSPPLRAPPTSVTWSLNCPASMAAAPSSIPFAVSALISDLIGAPVPVLQSLETVDVRIVCTNCVVRDDRPGSFVVGQLRYNPAPDNSGELPQRMIFPSVTVNNLQTPVIPTYATCSSTFSDRNRAIQTAAFGAITTTPGGGGSITMSHRVGNAAASSLYPLCYSKAVQFYPSDLLKSAAVTGRFTFVITITAKGSFPSLTRTVTAPLTLIINTDTCTGPVVNSSPVVPSFITTGVTFRNARCPGAKTGLFHDTGLQFISPSADASLSASRVTCTGCPASALYFQAGVFPPASPVYRASWTGGGKYGRGVCAVKRRAGDPGFAYFLYPSSSLDFLGQTLILPFSSPLLLTADTFVPPEAFAACLQDLFFVHNASFPGALLPASVSLTVSAIRNDGSRLITTDASLTVRFPPTADCSAGVSVEGESVVFDEETSVAKVVAPAVVVPVVAVAALAAAVVVIRKKRSARRIAAVVSSQTQASASNPASNPASEQPTARGIELPASSVRTAA